MSSTGGATEEEGVVMSSRGGTTEELNKVPINAHHPRHS